MIKIYIANLYAYNQGKLTGQWIDLSEETEESLQEKIDSILKQGGGEEILIADFECDDIESLKVTKDDDPFKLLELEKELSSLDKDDLAKVNYLLSRGCTIEEALRRYEDVIFYPGMTLEDVAYELVAEGVFGNVSERLLSYIDYEKLAQDLSIDGYEETEEGVFYYA